MLAIEFPQGPMFQSMAHVCNSKLPNLPQINIITQLIL